METCSISMVPLMTASAICGRSASSSAEPKHISSTECPNVSAAMARRRSEGSATATIRSSSGLWRA